MVRKGSILRYLAVILVSSCLVRAGLHDSGAIKNTSLNSSTEPAKENSIDVRNSSPTTSDEIRNDIDTASNVIYTYDSHYRDAIILKTELKRNSDESSVPSFPSENDTNFWKLLESDGLKKSEESKSSPPDNTTPAGYINSLKTFSLRNHRRKRSLRSEFEIPRNLSHTDDKHSNSRNFSLKPEPRLDIISLTNRSSIDGPYTRNTNASLFKQEGNILNLIHGEELSSHLFEDYAQDSPSLPASINSQSSISGIDITNTSPNLSVESISNISISQPQSQHLKSDSKIPEDVDSGSRDQLMEGVGRTTSHREALVRAALITEDRGYRLRMLPRNKMVGLTLEPNTRHRLLFPVERSGFLSISLAPCGLPVQWSLALRPLPPQAATQEALNREGQDATHSAEDLEAHESGPLAPSLGESGEGRRGVVMLAARQEDDKLHTNSVKSAMDNGEQANTAVAGSGIEKTEKGTTRVGAILSENDVLFQETVQSTTIPENNTKLSQRDVSDNVSNQMNINKTNSKGGLMRNAGTTSGLGNRWQRRISFPEDKYKQSDTLRSVLSDEFRKTNNNVYSLKNLAYDIGRSDFFENEFNQIRYHQEYEETLRGSRERRDTSRVKLESPHHQTSTKHCSANDGQCSNSLRGVRYVSSGTFPEELWFEDAIHSNWLDGNYTDDSDLDSTRDKSNKYFDNIGDFPNVIFIPRRYRDRVRRFRNNFKKSLTNYTTSHERDRNYTKIPSNNDEANPYWSIQPQLVHGVVVKNIFTHIRSKIPYTTSTETEDKRGVRSYRTKVHNQINLNAKISMNPNELGEHTPPILPNNHQRHSRSAADPQDSSVLRPSAYIFLNYVPSLPSQIPPKQQSNLLEMKCSDTTTIPVPTDTSIAMDPSPRGSSNLREMRFAQTTTNPVPTQEATVRDRSPSEHSKLLEKTTSDTTTVPILSEISTVRDAQPWVESNLGEMRLSQTTTAIAPTDNSTTMELQARKQNNLKEMRISETTTVSAPTDNTTTASDPLLRMSIRDIINSIWRRPKLKTSKVLQVKESNNSSRSEAQDIASTTIWGRSSSYDELDSGHGDQVWIFQRRNATPGIYVITVSSGSSAVSLQAMASRRPFASYYKPLPVTAMVSRRHDEPPVLTVSWLTSKESSKTPKTKRPEHRRQHQHQQRQQESLQGAVNRRLARLQRTRSRFNRHPRKNRRRSLQIIRNSVHDTDARSYTKRDVAQQDMTGERDPFTRDRITVQETALSDKVSTTRDRSDSKRRETYCLALSEVKPHESLCGARGSRETSLRLGCTRQPHYSLPLAPHVYKEVHPKKRYFVTVWKPGSLMPLGQTTLRGSGRGRVPRLRQGVLHRILFSSGGAATAKFRVRRSQPRLHVAAVSCRGGLAVTVRQGGPKGLRVVRAGGNSALILAVHNPPKGLLHLTVTPSIPHTAHTFFIAAATTARRLPFPRLPQSHTVQADVTSCTSGRLSWQSAPGHPKYCVLLQEVEGRPKIAWPTRQCGWDRQLSDPASLSHCSVGFRGGRQAWELLRLKDNTTYTVTVLVTHRLTNRSLSLSPAVLTTPACL